MRLIPAACAGFLIAVLWMDLIFDTQVLRHRRVDPLPESVLGSISAYYHRATTTSRPMGHVIAVVMAILLAALVFRAVAGFGAGWLLAVSGVLAGAPILLALFRTVPNAIALGKRDGGAAEQTRLARAVLGDHLLCLVSLSAFLVLWIATG